MRKQGIKSDEHTYTTLLNMFAKMKLEKEALSVLKVMENEGINPNELTYSIIIDMYVFIFRLSTLI